MIYFITAREIGRVKIGYSKEPHKRFSKVQSDSPLALKLERICAGDRAEEAGFHARFAGLRTSGEWFDLSPEIEAQMSTLPKAIAPCMTPRIALTGPLGRWIAENSHTVESFGALVGSTGATISRVCNRKNGASVKLLRKIVMATGGQVTADQVLFGDDGFGFAEAGAEQIA